jgi:hypothetical protein
LTAPSKKALDAAHFLGAGDQRRQDQRRTVQRPERVEIIEFKTLNEGPVEQCRRRA